VKLVARRLLAFGVDYLLISAYLLVLVAASLAVLASGARDAYLHLWSTSWSAEAAGFLLLTLPVVVYFAILESSPARSTLGKRAVRLQVVAIAGGSLSLGRSILRSSLKFAPWELAHFTIWHVVYGGGGNSTPPTWSYLTLGAVYFLVGIYLLTLFIGRSHRTIYDRISDASVIRRMQSARNP
jgi:uncharacterized RDD family membrane protein YckC